MDRRERTRVLTMHSAQTPFNDDAQVPGSKNKLIISSLTRDTKVTLLRLLLSWVGT